MPGMSTVRAAAAALVVASMLAPAAARAAEPDLVLLGEPSASESLQRSAGPVTLSYRVLEVFSGEPGAASVIVRHDGLDPAVRARLAAGERVLVVARPDPDLPGRWVAGEPLWATDQAVAAMRQWSAPSDVRPQRPIEDVVATVSAMPAPTAAPEPVPEPRIERVVAERAAEREPVQVVEREEAVERVAAARVAAEPEETEADDAPEDVGERDAWPEVLLRDPEPRGSDAGRDVEHAATARRATPRASDLPPATSRTLEARPRPVADDEPPLLYVQVLQPTPGPGSPPSPTGRVLGPPLDERRDLKTRRERD